MNDNDHSEGDSEVRDDENDIDEDANVLRNEVFVGSLSMVRQRGSGDWPPLQGWHTLQHHHHPPPPTTTTTPFVRLFT